MTTARHSGALYNRAPIMLWVEDTLTRDYLKEVWANDPRVGFLIGGGKAAVRAIVEDAGLLLQ